WVPLRHGCEAYPPLWRVWVEPQPRRVLQRGAFGRGRPGHDGCRRALVGEPQPRALLRGQVVQAGEQRCAQVLAGERDEQLLLSASGPEGEQQVTGPAGPVLLPAPEPAQGLAAD